MAEYTDPSPLNGYPPRTVSPTLVYTGQLLLILVLSIFSRFSVMDLEDASTLFNYHNNVDGSVGLFVYNGYVPFSMELVAWAAAPAPIALQVLIYAGSAIGLGLLLAHQLIRTFTAIGYRWPALLTSGTLVLLHFTWSAPREEVHPLG